MHIQHCKLGRYPEDFAVSKSGSFLVDGAFLLDFTRPLIVRRWLGIWNTWIGLAGWLLVPVVHESEETGGYIIPVGRSDPFFHDIRSLWKERYPAPKRRPVIQVDPLDIIADFSEQFPDVSGV
jgi:hypothetical protein